MGFFSKIKNFFGNDTQDKPTEQVINDSSNIESAPKVEEKTLHAAEQKDEEQLTQQEDLSAEQADSDLTLREQEIGDGLACDIDERAKEEETVLQENSRSQESREIEESQDEQSTNITASEETFKVSQDTTSAQEQNDQEKSGFWSRLFWVENKDLASAKSIDGEEREERERQDETETYTISTQDIAEAKIEDAIKEDASILVSQDISEKSAEVQEKADSEIKDETVSDEISTQDVAEAKIEEAIKEDASILVSQDISEKSAEVQEKAEPEIKDETVTDAISAQDVAEAKIEEAIKEDASLFAPQDIKKESADVAENAEREIQEATVSDAISAQDVAEAKIEESIKEDTSIFAAQDIRQESAELQEKETGTDTIISQDEDTEAKIEAAIQDGLKEDVQSSAADQSNAKGGFWQRLFWVGTPETQDETARTDRRKAAEAQDLVADAKLGAEEKAQEVAENVQESNFEAEDALVDNKDKTKYSTALDETIQAQEIIAKTLDVEEKAQEVVQMLQESNLEAESALVENKDKTKESIVVDEQIQAQEIIAKTLDAEEKAQDVVQRLQESNLEAESALVDNKDKTKDSTVLDEQIQAQEIIAKTLGAEEKAQDVVQRLQESNLEAESALVENKDKTKKKTKKKSKESNVSFGKTDQILQKYVEEVRSLLEKEEKTKQINQVLQKDAQKDEEERALLDQEEKTKPITEILQKDEEEIGVQDSAKEDASTLSQEQDAGATEEQSDKDKCGFWQRLFWVETADKAAESHDLAKPMPQVVAPLPYETREKPQAAPSSAMILKLRQAPPKLSAWLAIILDGVETKGSLLNERLEFLLQALEAPQAEIELFIDDFNTWLKRMDYEYVDEFRSELQYRLALALELEDEEDERNRLFVKIQAGLSKTREQLAKKLDSLFASHGSFTEEFWENLEEVFITADLGYEASLGLVERLKKRVRNEHATKTEELRELLRAELADIFKIEPHITAYTPPEVILMVGVNGVGKTTTIGKLANRERMRGRKVMIAAADTFRAAAIEQLEVWAKRAGALFYAKPQGSDPASVAYEAMDAALKQNVDLLFIDTAGRLQTKVNLMEELKKIRTVTGKKHKGAPNRTILVLDATTGQNALSQVKLFQEACHVDELIVTKLDGTAKGGFAIALALQFHIPISYIGLGEKMEDLRPFNGADFATGLLGEGV